MAGAGHPWCMIPMYPSKNIFFLCTLYLTHQHTTQTTTRPTTRVITKIAMTKCGKMEFRTHGFTRSIAYRRNRLVNRKTAIVVKMTLHVGIK